MPHFRRSWPYVSLLACIAVPTLTAAQTPAAREVAVQSAIPSDEEAKSRLAKAAPEVLRQYWGSVLVVRNGEVLFADARGIANLETNEPNRLGTRFNLASIGKLFTRIATLQLAEQGKLDLDATVGTYLPNYPNREVAQKVTIRQLFEMKSGLGSYWNALYAERREKLLTSDDYIALFASDPLAFEPGTNTLYSNAGYILLGRIIEQVSGLAFPDYVRERIAVPAGMTATGFDRLDELGAGTAIGYRSAGQPTGTASHGDTSPTGQPTTVTHGASIPQGATVLQPNTDELPGRGLAAGGAYSTVDDFARLDTAIRSGKLLNKTSLGILFGKGFAGGTKMSGIAGGFPGVSTDYILFPDGLSIIAFSNRDMPPSPEISRALARIAGRNAPPPPQAARPS